MIKEMAIRAVKIAKEHERLQMAKQDKQAAQAEFLRAVLDAARPALPALCSRIPHVPGPAIRALNVGHMLYLDESGVWLEMCEGGSLILSRTDEVVSRDFIIEDIVDVISMALTKHAGSRECVTTEIKREAERLRAATLLLRGST